MQTRARRRLLDRRLARACIALLLAPAAWLSAEGVSPVTVDTLLGFNGMVHAGRVTPLLVSVENTGHRLDAVLSVTLTRGSELRGTLFTRTFTRRVALAAASSRRIPFTVPIDTNPSSLVVTVSSQDKVLARQETDLRQVATSSRLVAAISSELSLDYLSGLSDGAGELHVAYPRIDDLPESWAGYDGVELVVVHDTYFQGIGAAQARALQEWVISGGTVAFCGGAAALQLASTGLSALVPVDVDGVVERAGLPSLAALARAPLPDGRVVLASSRLVSGSVLAAEGDLPLVVERRVGKGAVWFLAFDPADSAFASWPGALSVWRLIEENGRRPLLATAEREALDDPWMQALLKSAPLAFPSGVAALAFLAAYLGLFVVPGLRGVNLGRRPLTRAALFVVIPAVAVAVGFLLFDRVLFRPSPSLVVGSRLEVAGSADSGLATEEIGVFSSRTAAPTLSVARRDVVVNEITPPLIPQIPNGSPLSPSGPLGHTIDLSDETAVRGITLGRFASRLFVLSSVVPAPYQVSLEDQGSSIHVVLKNGSRGKLSDCFLTLEGHGYALGSATAGQTLDRTLKTSEGRDLSDPTQVNQLFGGERRSAFWEEAYGRNNHGVTTIAGWLDAPALPLAAGRDLVRSGPLSLLVVEVP